MRTTIDLPEDLHQQAKAIARAQSCTMSEAIALLLRKALGERLSTPRIGVNELTGLPAVDTGRVITSEDIKQLEDEE